MRYIIDFDRTILDVDSMKRVLGDEGIQRIIAGLEFFKPGELSPFVYRDAYAFLRDDTTQRTLLSLVASTTEMPTSLSFQCAKIMASGIREFFPTRIVEEAPLKGPILAQFCRANGILFSDIIMVDDLAEQLDSVIQDCPGARTIRIDRSLRSGNGGNVIASFAELPDLLRRTH